MPQALSEKAKGKQRAVEPPEPPPKPTSRALAVRFTEGVPDLVLVIHEKDSVREIKKNIRAARPQLKNRRLRLIHSGRLLTDGTFLFSWLNTLEERQRRAALSRTSSGSEPLDEDGNETAPVEAPTASTAGVMEKSFLHCSIGPEFAEGEEEEEAKAQTAQIKPLRGFDRLATAGFSEADIANFRRQFHSSSSADYLSTAEFATEEEYEEHARALEEQWIDSLDNAGSATISQSDRGTAILEGILIGFFFPFLPFFFFRSWKPPVFWENGTSFEPPGSVVFSRRMQMGLVVGFLVNVMFGLWRYLWGSL
ncbi:hypothetical protein DENSPDRAFT_349233 [Dentipellis sp. KUC8613]|nr:hypothetical protein DENSPDRAFT_349233 [Dentipellis sp. KUC8613]